MKRRGFLKTLGAVLGGAAGVAAAPAKASGVLEVRGFDLAKPGSDHCAFGLAPLKCEGQAVDYDADLQGGELTESNLEVIVLDIPDDGVALYSSSHPVIALR